MHILRVCHRVVISGIQLIATTVLSTGIVLAAAGEGGQASASSTTGYAVDTLAEGLNFPWCVAFLPDGRMLVTQRSGELRYVELDGTVSAPIAGTPEPYVKSQGGLFDVLLAPDFESSGKIYLSLAAGTPQNNSTQVVSATLNGMALTDQRVIFEVAFKKDTPVHYGGRMIWDATGHLLLTTGDGFNFREQAQDPANQMGKIIRMTANGDVPDDQPLSTPANADPYVYSYGHRNPQGLAIDPATGRIYEQEHGPRGGDEINLIEPGRNYGWPMVSFGLDYSGALISPFTQYPGITDPLLHWTPSIAASGLAVYRGSAFPDWQGDLLAGGLVEKSLRRVDMQNGAVVGQEILLQELEERIRDVRVGPDGLIYVLTDSATGKLLRLRPNS